MTTALAERPAALPADQLELVRRTVAKDATNDELALFLYDCQRRGVHPLDKLLHFTKRGGRYTPVTSIDFMRSQAAASGEMAGSDDPVFLCGNGEAIASATVTVYRITQGQRFAYSATARWSEYCPDNAPMWKRMPHTMLGKCAEALALRKAFPQQLAGLYAREEMDQADEPKAGYSVEAPRAPGSGVSTVPTQSIGDSERRPSGAELLGDAAFSPDSNNVPSGTVLLTRIDMAETRNKNVRKYTITVQGGQSWPADQTTVSTIKEPFAALAEQCVQNRTPVFLTTKKTNYGYDVATLDIAAEIAATKFVPDAPVLDSEIPF